MLSLVNTLIAISVIAVVLTLLLGVYTMARGGEGAGKRSNVLMRWRIVLQAIAIVMLLIGFFLKAKMRGG